MAGIVGAKLLALCTVAVGALYTAGYVYTEPQAQASGVAQAAGSAVNPPAVPTSPSSALSSAPPSSTAAPKKTSSASSAAKHSASPPSSSTPSSSKKSSAAPASSKVVYKDGTYTGSGSNVYGTLSVAVVIKGGKIASVQLTSYSMHYPPSFIYPQMANQMVQMQTWRVYVVSGATASSYNFAEAVYYALKKAGG